MLSSALYRAVGMGTNPKLVARQERDGEDSQVMGPSSADTVPWHCGFGVGQITFQSLSVFFSQQECRGDNMF